MQNKYITVIVVAAVLVAGGYALSKKASYSSPAQQNQTQNQNPTPTPTPTTPTPTGTSAQTQTQPVLNPTPAHTQSGGTTSTKNTSTATTATITPKSFSVNGNDTSADLTTITVAKGTPVSITFGADAQGTYHGGLDFRSSVVSTGTIAPGSTKTVSFTAAQSFSFQPYWPSTNIAKPYQINVVVQ